MESCRTICLSLADPLNETFSNSSWRWSRYFRKRLTAALLELHALSFWVSVELMYTHQATEIVDMKPQYLHSGKLVLTHITD